LRVAYEGGVSGAGFEEDDLRATSGAVEHAVWEAPHLGVAALAGVLVQSVRQGDYLLQGPQDGALEGVAARVALGQVEPSSTEFAAPARRANEGVRLGCLARWKLHLLLLLHRLSVRCYRRNSMVDPRRNENVMGA